MEERITRDSKYHKFEVEVLAVGEIAEWFTDAVNRYSKIAIRGIVPHGDNGLYLAVMEVWV